MLRFVPRHVCLLIALALVSVATRQVVAENILVTTTPKVQNGTPPAINKVAIIEPYWAWDEHSAFKLDGVKVITELKSFGVTIPRYHNHTTGVANRFFDTGFHNDGVADRARWRALSYAYNPWNDDSDFVDAINAAAIKAKIINMSVKTITDVFNTSGNDVVSDAVDKAAFNQRVLITKSAGNDGPTEKTLTRPGGAYNNLTVGAVAAKIETPASGPLPKVGRADVAIAGFSSRGPTTDGRTKPDIVAPGGTDAIGVDLKMAGYGNGTNINQVYEDSGTSFAAPYVAGVAAKLIDGAAAIGWNTDPLVLKAVLLNSAQEVTGDTWEGWADEPERRHVPLDKDQGAGEVSYERAVQQYIDVAEQHANNYVELIGWDYGTISPNTYTNYVLNKWLGRGSVIQATLDWFREFDGAGNVLELDDLDLELWRFDGLNPVEKITLSNSAKDSVEHIHRFEIREKGYYGLRVNFFGDVTYNGADDYGLAWFTHFSVPEPSTYVLAVLGGVVLLFRTRRTGHAAVKRA